MEIKSQFEYHGKIYKSHWVEGDPNANLDNVVLHGVHAVCFCGDKMVIVFDQIKMNGLRLVEELNLEKHGRKRRSEK